MSRRTAAQKLSYAQAEQVDRGANRHYEGRRKASASIVKNDVRSWNKRFHSLERAYERHGVVIDLFGLQKIEERIKTGQTVQPGLLLLGHSAADRFKRRTSFWLATMSGRIVPLVFDHDASAITTVLPMDAYQFRFEDGRFVSFVDGGTKTGRDYWAAITQ